MTTTGTSRTSRTSRLLAAMATAALLASCGGSGDSAGGESGDVGGTVGGGSVEDLDLSFDLDELDAQAEADQQALDDVDLSQGFQCPSIANQTVDDLTEAQVSGVREGEDGCIFAFGGRDLDPLRIDAYTDDIWVSDAQGAADVLLASTGGRQITVPNALAAYVFEEGFMPDNLGDTDGPLGAGRQVIGYFLGPRGIHLVAVFPDAIVGIYDGSDAVVDEPARTALFEQLISSTVYAGS